MTPFLGTARAEDNVSGEGISGDLKDGSVGVIGRIDLDRQAETGPGKGDSKGGGAEGGNANISPPEFFDDWSESTVSDACQGSESQFCDITYKTCDFLGSAVEDSAAASDFSVAPTVQTGIRVSNVGAASEDLGSRCYAARAGSPGGAEGPGAAPVIITVTQADFARLPIGAPTAHAGPPDGWVPVNLDVVMYAEDSGSQTLTTDILGAQVRIQATPVSYSWDLGDGTVITSDDPGRPYPHKDVTGSYAYQGWYDITLTTTYGGQFSVGGGPWQTIDGTIEVESESVPIYSKSLESRLVDGDKPVDEGEVPWIPERTKDTEGPKNPSSGGDG